MFIDLTPEQRALRDELRGYFAGLLTPAERAELLTERHGAAYRDVVRRMGRDGWLGVGWPARYGGRGFGQVEQQIFAETRRPVPTWPLPAVQLPETVGPDPAGARQRPGSRTSLLPKILAGEVHFAIGYTEPEAGTDLASLRNRAVRDGEEYVVDGQKIFTTGAHAADYVWLACRTAPDAPKHKGISILIADTTDPGFSWTPIITHDGRPPRQRDLLLGRAGPVRMRVGAENEGLAADHHPAQPRAGHAPARPAGSPPCTTACAPGPPNAPCSASRTVCRALARASAVIRVNELLNWQIGRPHRRSTWRMRPLRRSSPPSSSRSSGRSWPRWWVGTRTRTRPPRT